MNKKNTFVHLRVRTSYSLLEGAISISGLVEISSKLNYPAVGITDRGNLFGALEASEAFAEKGIQPIIGCQLNLEFSKQKESEKSQRAYIVLLAKSEVGYRNLMKLSSTSFLEAGNDDPHVKLETLQRYSDELILLSGGPDGPIGKLLLAGKFSDSMDLSQEFKGIFGDRFYIEIQRHLSESGAYLDKEKFTEADFLKIAYEKDIPIVATNDVYFLEKDMFDAHDALMCIADGDFVDQRKEKDRLTRNHHFASQDEMAEVFQDLPEAIENTIEIAKRCAFKVKKREPILPKFATNEVDELRKQAHIGLEERMKNRELSAKKDIYIERLDYELAVIEKMGYPGYFLIVSDFIKWAKGKGIPVGPGRGSGAGSLVAYALTITDLDPLRYKLLFERFLNPDRVSMPDFDIDFCMDRRDEVISYVQEKYGKDRVAQIITFGAMLSKMAIRDIGRVLNMPYGQVDRLAKMIPSDGVKPLSIKESLKEEPRLIEEREKEEVVDRLLNYSQKLEGLYRNVATHAAGVVIADRPLDELVPVYLDPRSEMPATQFSMKWAEESGLVKFDFLGLKTLTVIKNAVDLIAQKGIKIDVESIPFDDKKTFQLYSEQKTVGVFQVESTGMKDALRRLQPNCIEDIIALVALYRPGPMENIPKFCDVKNNRVERTFIHPSIDDLLDETQGIIVYQEQVMEIARRMAGYSLGEADLLRRAMGKKIKSAMDSEKPRFLTGANKNNIDEKTSNFVWDLLEKFANYGFNKSHAAAYAVVSYQTAWLKANHPVEFMAAVMNSDIHNTEKLRKYRVELTSLGIDLLPACINQSESMFSVEGNKIFYALSALKNVGIEAMQRIQKEREKDGNFEDILDFGKRIDLKKVGKRPLETLVRSGAFDDLHPIRKQLFSSLDHLVSFSAKSFDDKNSSQTNLFGENIEKMSLPILVEEVEWEENDRLREEYLAYDFYFSGHPLDEHFISLAKIGILKSTEIYEKARANPLMSKLCGQIQTIQERKSARGNKFAFIQMDDPSGTFEVTVFSQVLDFSRDFLFKGSNVVLNVEASIDGHQLKLLAKSIEPLEKVINETPGLGLRVFIDSKDAARNILEQLEVSLKDNSKKEGPIELIVISSDLEKDVRIKLSKGYKIDPMVAKALKLVPGVIDAQTF